MGAVGAVGILGREGTGPLSGGSGEEGFGLPQSREGLLGAGTQVAPPHVPTFPQPGLASQPLTGLPERLPVTWESPLLRSASQLPGAHGHPPRRAHRPHLPHQSGILSWAHLPGPTTVTVSPWPSSQACSLHPPTPDPGCCCPGPTFSSQHVLVLLTLLLGLVTYSNT